MYSSPRPPSRLAACSGDDGQDGDDGLAGNDGTDGTNGLSCWDLNQNGVADLDTEDIEQGRQGRRRATAARRAAPTTRSACTRATSPRTPTPAPASASNCHGKIGDDVMTTGHWKWEGVSSNIAGLRGRDPWQEGPDQQLLPGRAVERGALHAVPHRHRLEGQEFRLRQSEEPRLPGLPRPDRHVQEGPDDGRGARPERQPAGGRAERRHERRRAAALHLRVLSRQRRRRRQRQARRHLDST